MTRIKELIAFLIVLQLASRVGHPVLEGRKKKFSLMSPERPVKSSLDNMDPFAAILQSASVSNSFIITDDRTKVKKLYEVCLPHEKPYNSTDYY